MSVDFVVNKILEGADVRKTLCESDSISPDTLKDLESWWSNMVDDFAAGWDDYSYLDMDVNAQSDGSISFFGSVDGHVFNTKMFKDVVSAEGVIVGKDIKVSKDSYSGGVKVQFLEMTPEEFVEKVF